MSDVADQFNAGDFESTVPEIGLNSWMEGVVGGVVGGVVVDFGTYM